MKSLGEIAIVGTRVASRVRVTSAHFGDFYGAISASVTSITPDRFPTQSFLHPAPDQAGRQLYLRCRRHRRRLGFRCRCLRHEPAWKPSRSIRSTVICSKFPTMHSLMQGSGRRAWPVADTGVYVGASSADHALRFFVDPTVADVHMMTGNSLSIMANRLSYAMDLRGPSLTIDTACSSSLVALHLRRSHPQRHDRHGDRAAQSAVVALLLCRLLASDDAVSDRSLPAVRLGSRRLCGAQRVSSRSCCALWRRLVGPEIGSTASSSDRA